MDTLASSYAVSTPSIDSSVDDFSAPAVVSKDTKLGVSQAGFQSQKYYLHLLQFRTIQFLKLQFPPMLVKLRILFYLFILGIKIDNGCGN